MPFTRLSARPTAGENSTGMGLSIVKLLVEAHGGKVWVENNLPNGARFTVEIPAVKETRPSRNVSYA
jgi:signal transduction histidine kinase